jgi:hypothetical protein
MIDTGKNTDKNKINPAKRKKEKNSIYANISVYEIKVKGKTKRSFQDSYYPLVVGICVEAARVGVRRCWKGAWWQVVCSAHI